jgi:hypothetical protein
MKKMNRVFIFLVCAWSLLWAQIPQWDKYETAFQSDKSYENPIYDVDHLKITFISPSGRQEIIHGFWDGEKTWRVRFMPDEIGTWTFSTVCSDKDNAGLHAQKGSFECIPNDQMMDIYRHGDITRARGDYHLQHRDGKPFFWTACTAWNGALLSTEEEWDQYLTHRRDHAYNVIQFVTTQWRGCKANRLGQTAFTGCGRIQLNPEFFQALDKRVDRINNYGLVAAPVLLWALPFGEGMEQSPGYSLPLREAVLLARYMVARYGGHHVVWILGGDGKYTDEYEQRWKEIGRRVFGDPHPGLVAQHPMGRSWIGDIYADESWLDIIGYQSSHSNKKRTVDWINKGPAASQWSQLPARPLINLEPNYEEIHFTITARDVRNASYWSLFATPVAGITYGANGIWPWLRKGDRILNHRHQPGTSPWYESIDFPGSLQIGLAHEFFDRFAWWELRPRPDLLVQQPGDETFDRFVSVAGTNDHSLILVYIPQAMTVKLYNPLQFSYTAKWFDPVSGEEETAGIESKNGQLVFDQSKANDQILILQKLD